MATDKRPVIKDIGDLRIIEATTVTEGVTTQTSFRWYHVAEDGEAYTGTSDKHWEDMSLDEFAASLEPIPDHHIYPELPADPAVTVAPDNLDESTAFIKRTGVTRYDPAHMLAPGNEGKDHLLEEVLRLETLSERPHPYLVRYLGCRVRHGRIRNIVLERLEWTLLDYAHEAPDKFAQIDKEAFLAGVESAVKYMHSLGLAHNDISPNNIMVREAEDGTLLARRHRLRLVRPVWEPADDRRVDRLCGHGGSGTFPISKKPRQLRPRPPV
jgi:serine/threonine protein kinase